MPLTPFRYLLRVRYGECDAQKVVFNARYGDYVELAVTEFMRRLGFEAELFDGRLDYQLVRQTLQWRAPARFDDVLAAEVSLVAIGTTSFTMAVRFLHAGRGDLLCEAETVYVMVGEGLRKTPVPQTLRSALAAGAPGVVVDHAGWLASPPGG